jgi:hypothetical protein
MQQHLPRELRDLVYNYVLDTSSKCVIVPMYRRAWEAERKTEVGGVLCNPWKPYFQYRNILHTLDESFVDLATRKELVEAFYYCSTFRFPTYLPCSSSSDDPFDHMLSGTDRFGFDMDVDDLVRNVNFDMPGFSVSLPARSTTHVLRILELYLKYNKHASSVKLHMGCKNVKTQQNLHSLVQYWTHLFPTLDKLISAGHDGDRSKPRSRDQAGGTHFRRVDAEVPHSLSGKLKLPKSCSLSLPTVLKIFT